MFMPSSKNDRELVNCAATLAAKLLNGL